MAAPARKTNWFAIWTSIIVVVIVIGAGGAIFLFNNMANPEYDFTASKIDEQSGAVSVGGGDQTVATYIDFMCPVCGSFETQYGDQLYKLASEDKIKLEFHPVSILDGASTGDSKYSTRSANAFYCVADTNSKAVVPFVESLFKNQPREQTEGLDDEKLVSMAKEAGADIKACQADLKFADKVAEYTEAMPADPQSGSKGTPTVTINGEYTSLGDIGTDRNWFKSKFGGE